PEAPSQAAPPVESPSLLSEYLFEDRCGTGQGLEMPGSPLLAARPTVRSIPALNDRPLAGNSELHPPCLAGVLQPTRAQPVWQTLIDYEPLRLTRRSQYQERLHLACQRGFARFEDDVHPTKLRFQLLVAPTGFVFGLDKNKVDS